MNGAFHVSTNVIQFIAASVAKAELGTLFHNCQTGIIFCSILEDMGQAQPKKPVHCNNVTADGIANSTAKWQGSCLMEMYFFELVTSGRKRFTHFTGIQDRRILQIIKASTTQACIMQLFAHGICMSLLIQVFSPGRNRPVL
jgi:hypothetical protein